MILKRLIWALFIFFVFGHLFANYKAVKSVIMKTFNRNRFHITCQGYFKSGQVLSPLVVNKTEPVLCTVGRYFKHIDFGCSIEKLDGKFDQNRFIEENYFIKFNLIGNLK